MNRPRIAFAAALTLLATSAVAAQPAPKAAGRVNGQIITMDEVLGRVKEVDAQRRETAGATPRDELQAMHAALDAIAETRLIAAEAAKLQTTPQQIVEAEIESNVAVPSPELVEQTYERNKARITIPRERALTEITRQLTDASRSAYRNALLRRLKRDYGFESYLEPLRTDVATAGSPSRGPEDAPVTIVEFADFECPFCGALFPALKALEKTYAKDVRVVYRHFPLINSHPHAQKAAEAAVCAEEQGRFWEMHDSLFGFQEDLTVESLKTRASELRLDAAAFNVCLDSGKAAARVKQDVAEAARAGVTGTPTLFVNGRILLGNQPAELRALIEDELKRKK